MPKSVFVPFSVAAKTREGLTDKMTRLKLSSKYKLEFFDIQWAPQEKKWVAWYYDEKQILIRRNKNVTS